MAVSAPGPATAHREDEFVEALLRETLPLPKHQAEIVAADCSRPHKLSRRVAG